MATPLRGRYQEYWIECYICGFCFPEHEMVLNYKIKKLVDPVCDDQMNHDDFLELVVRGKERHDPPVDGKICAESEGAEEAQGIGGAGHTGGASHPSGAGF